MSQNSKIEWTAVAAALPDDDILVLLALENSEVWPGVRDYGRWIYLSGAEVRERVTHWMPLPAAPSTADSANTGALGDNGGDVE